MQKLESLPLPDEVIDWFFDSINEIQNNINKLASDETNNKNTKNKNKLNDKDFVLKSNKFINELKWTYNPLRIYYQNVRNLCNKNHSIKPKTYELEYDVILLTETFFNCNNSNEEYFCDQYTFYRCDRSELNSAKSSGGGALIAIRKNENYSTEDLNLTEFKDIEIVGARIRIADKKSIIIFCVYIPPNRATSIEAYNRVLLQ